MQGAAAGSCCGDCAGPPGWERTARGSALGCGEAGGRGALLRVGRPQQVTPARSQGAIPGGATWPQAQESLSDGQWLCHSPRPPGDVVLVVRPRPGDFQGCFRLPSPHRGVARRFPWVVDPEPSPPGTPTPALVRSRLQPSPRRALWGWCSGLTRLSHPHGRGDSVHPGCPLSCVSPGTPAPALGPPWAWPAPPRGGVTASLRWPCCPPGPCRLHVAPSPPAPCLLLCL